MAKTKESKLEEEVSKFMKQRGVWQLARFQAQSNQNGLPDRLYLYKGVLLGFELKTDTGEPTDLQLKKLEEINNNGGVGLIIRNVNTIASVLNLIDAVRVSYPSGHNIIRMGLEEFYEEY
jgi:hypothetical protein